MSAAASLCLGYAAFSALCLAMERHWSDRFGRDALPGRWRWPLQLLGAALLLASLAFSVVGHGVGIGLVTWLGGLTAAGMALVLTLTYWPRAVTLAWPILLGAGLLSAAMNW